MTIAVQGADLAPATPARGILMALTAFALFTGMDTAIKVLGGHYHVVQVAFFNSLFALVAVVAIALARGRRLQLWPRHWRLHLARWSCSYLATLAIFWSYPRLPLAQAYAILFASPLLVTALSVLVLGEPVGWRRWAAVLAGFAGVLVVLDPGHDRIDWPALVTLAGATGHAFNLLFIRKIAVRGEPVEATGVAGNGLTLLVSVFVLPFVWVAPTPHDLALSTGAGLTAGAAFLLLTTAFHSAPAALVASYQYSQMIYGLAVGWLLFGDLPTARMLLGASIIIAGGLYVLRHETRAGRSATVA